jgi:hypothetical protein
MASALAAGYIGIWTARSIPPSPTADPPQAEVILHSFRGANTSTAHAPARSPLAIHIDPADITLTQQPGDLTGAPDYRLEVVTASGKQVWNRAPDVTAGSISTHLPKGLPTCLYWVRLYAGKSRILREFGLLLE